MMRYFIIIIAIMIIIAIIIITEMTKNKNNRKKIDPIKVLILNGIKDGIKEKKPISIAELEKLCDNHEISPDVVEETRQVITITD